MFTQLAPTGLPSTTKPHRSHQAKIEQTVADAIRDILATHSSLDHKMLYNLAHPNTITLVRSLDAFFAHGLLLADKCYWAFVREFVTNTERVELKLRWGCANNRRALSLSWLKDALNRANLHFQLLSFISCPDSLKRAHYDKNACMRNRALLKRVCVLVDRLTELHFLIEPPYVFRPEDTPIAMPIADGTMSPIGSSNSSLINGNNSVQPNLPMNIHRRAQCNAVAKSLGTSYCEVARGSFLDGLVNDLPEVDLSTLGTSIEPPVVQSDNEQSYILDQLLRRQRKSFTNMDNVELFEEEDEKKAEEEEQPGTANNTAKEQQHPQSLSSYVPEDPLTAAANDNKEQKPKTAEGTAVAGPSASSASLNSSSVDGLLMGGGGKLGSTSTREDGGDEMSELDEKDVLIEGEVLLENWQKIELCLNVCADEVETVHHLFQVFVAHATGHPALRYLLLTNKFIYLLAAADPQAAKGGDPGFDVADQEELGAISAASAVQEEWPAEVFEQNQWHTRHGTLPTAPKKFEMMSLLPLCDLDHMTVGIDAQVLCFHSRRKKFRATPQSGHEQRLMMVETGSRLLGKTIAFAVRKIVEQRASGNQRDVAIKRDSMQAVEANELGLTPGQHQSSSLCVSASHSSQLALVLKRFLRRELGIQRPEIVHHSLVYWHQADAPRDQRAERRVSDGSGGTGMMECYMYVRELYQRNWSRRAGTGEWAQSYVVLSGSKLYQFTDSTYKFAQRSLNLRDVVEQVYQAELRNDEKYVFQLDFREDAQINGSGGNDGDDGGGPLLSGIQCSCPSLATMQKWIGNLSMALSQPGEQPLPVACMAVLTETHVLFAQEGVNCLVDGFMRALSAFHVHEIAEICAIRTEYNSALVIRRDNGLDEWMLFREVAELDRLVGRLRNQWQFPVQECSSEENLLNPTCNQLFLQCCQMPDQWHNLKPEAAPDDK